MQIGTFNFQKQRNTFSFVQKKKKNIIVTDTSHMTAMKTDIKNGIAVKVEQCPLEGLLLKYCYFS